MSIGSVVGVGYRRTGASWHQLGVIVKLEEKEPNSWSRSPKDWIASVVWHSWDRGVGGCYNGPTFMSQFPVRDLLVIDDETIDEDLLGALENAYADWVFSHTPDFARP